MAVAFAFDTKAKICCQPLFWCYFAILWQKNSDQKL